jgi:hypothetical protein
MNYTKTREWTPEGLSVHAPYVTPVVLLLNDTNIIWYENRTHHKHIQR